MYVVLTITENMEVAKAKGYTLIELITVIVIVGTLTVTAAPVFINIADDAETSQTLSTMSAFKNGLHLLHVKRIVSGTDTLDINNTPIAFSDDGWPVGSSRNSQGCAELWDALMEGVGEINVVQTFSNRLEPGWNTFAHQDICAYINTDDNVPVAQNDAPHFVYFIDDMTFPGRGLNYDGKAGDVIAYRID
ncbi:prepilin-type N-terminal cleavage/methylation domain-containing protein [Alteromonas sp. ZYF713]|nr:prepilin-type N-terminal cleavage/methylation domain-containing protein [Alteromonas sp. ZYF713]